MNRRNFIKIGLAAGGGLMCRFSTAIGNSETSEPDQYLNNFVRIDQNNRATIMVGRPEIGQGSRTVLPMIIAEELDLDWDQVLVKQAEFDQKYGGQWAGGSLSVRLDYQPLREVGATIRQMFLQAAAQYWQVDANRLSTHAGHVISADGKLKIAYGKLAPIVVNMPVPEPAPLKSEKDFKLIGRGQHQIDNAEIVNGTIEFGLDKELPGMLHAVVQRSPTLQGVMESVDDTAAKAIPGVRDIVALDNRASGGKMLRPNIPNMVNGVAVVADSLWVAMKAREQLKIEWNSGAAEHEGSSQLFQRMRALSDLPGEVLRSDGDFDNTFNTAARRLQAQYEVPFLAHMTMEPMNCVVQVTPDRCEIWAPTQNPERLSEVAQLLTGLPAEQIKVNVLRSGGGFGRRYYPDYVIEAIHLSKHMKAPVKVVWTREDDLTNGFFRPAGVHTMRAAISDNGRLKAWSHHLVNPSRSDYLERTNPPSSTELYAFDFPAGVVDNLHMEYVPVHSNIPRGQWRAIAWSANIFAVNCFLDEVAESAGTDLLQLLKQLVGDHQELPYFTRTYDVQRLLKVAQIASEAAKWDQPVRSGRGRGLAICYSQGSFVAEVVEVTARSDQDFTVDRVVAAIDCGLAVNPSGVIKQVEGAIIEGLSAALYGEVTVKAGKVEQTNFDRYRLLTLADCPSIEVHIVPGNGIPMGVGEPPLPPVAPALVNALYQATGRRIRKLPVIANKPLTG